MRIRCSQRSTLSISCYVRKSGRSSIQNDKSEANLGNTEKDTSQAPKASVKAIGDLVSLP